MKTGPYICYPWAVELGWKLADGSNIPEKKFWQDVKFDKVAREFKGNIEWPIPFNGVKR